MIPSNGITSIYVRFAGEQSLLSMAQSNMIGNFDRISKVRTHTFLSNNAQTPEGVSRNFGADRFYCWDDTTIDCSNNPALIDSDAVSHLKEQIASDRKFQILKSDLENRMGGEVTVEPFVQIVRGEDNMRYNIRRQSKVDDFDMIRVGIRVHAQDEQAFKAGLKAMADEENPFKMKPLVQHAMQNEASMA